MLATVVGGEQRPNPIGGARAQEFEDPSTRLVYLIRQALEGMRHATAALFGPDHLAADDIGAAYESLATVVSRQKNALTSLSGTLSSRITPTISRLGKNVA